MSGPAPICSFVRRSGIHFSVDGKPARFVGTNSYYQMIHRRTGHAGADEVLDAMAARSMNLLRTWAFQDQGERPWDCLIEAPAEQLPAGKQPIDYAKEETLVALDQTIAAASSRGIYVVLTLVNNWDDFGGMNRWTAWRSGHTDHDRFYVDPTIRIWYKELASMLINRVNTITGRTYREDPTIFAWELTNEARLTTGTATQGQLNDWFGEMSAYIKSIDPNHMVTTGIEGFYAGNHGARNTDGWMTSAGGDFIDNHRHDSIDYATCHIWPQNWGWNPTRDYSRAMKKASQFLQRRIYDAQSTLGKPLVLEEFGIPRDDSSTGPGGPTTIRDRFFRDVFFQLAESSLGEDGAFGGSTVWSIFDDTTADWDDGNAVFVPHDASTDAILIAHAQRITSLPRPNTA